MADTLTFDEFLPGKQSSTKAKNPILTPAQQRQWNADHDVLGKGKDGTAFYGKTAPDFQPIVIGPRGEEVNSPSGKLNVGEPQVGRTMTFEDIPKEPAQYDVGNSFVDDLGNYTQGIRKGVVDLGMGINQRFAEGANWLEQNFGGQGINKAFGAPNADEILANTNKLIEDRKQYYEPLSRTKAGIAGDATGQIVATLPFSFSPAAATIRGSAAIGAGQGFIQPTTGNESAMDNAAVGGVLGGILPGLFGLGRVGKQYLYDPFTKTGIDKRAMELLDAYGVKPRHLVNVDSKTTVTGARPTMAEQIIDPEGAQAAAKLQDNLATLPDQQRYFAVRAMDNNEARLNTLSQVAGVAGPKDAALKARKAAAEIEYGEAYKVPFDVAKFPAAQKAAYEKLMAKPAILDAMKLAEKEAANRGLKFDPNTDVQSLHIVKEMLDALLNKAEANGQSMVGLTTAKKELVESMKNISKRYDTARKGFAERSIPINQMDVAEELIKRGTSPTPDLYGNPQLRVGGLLGAMKDDAGLIRRATGGYGGDTIDGLLTPDQFAKVKAVADETGIRSAVVSAGLGSGSPTAQRGLGVDLLMGGGGLATGGKLNVLRSAANYAKGKLIEPKVQETLRDMALNPGRAQELMKRLSPKDRGIVQEAIQNRLVQQSLRSVLPALYNSSD